MRPILRPGLGDDGSKRVIADTDRTADKRIARRLGVVNYPAYYLDSIAGR